MSATDQAFIRAYAAPGSPAMTASAPPRAQAATHRSAPEASVPQAAATAPGTSIGARPNSHTTSIHIGLGSVVPAPHAAFVSKIAAAMAAGQQQAAGGAASTLTAALAVPTSRGPLSSFSGQATGAVTISTAPKPELEIDAVRWPATCQQLLSRYAERFDRLAEQLRGEISAGTRLLAITGMHRREGRTTLALCLARQLAAANVKLALVDADFSNPRLASQLSIGVQRGWESVLCGEESPWEVMIESMADRLALLPLGAPATAEEISIGSYRIAATLHELAEHYELVLIDAGPIGLDESSAHWLFESTAGVQAAILAYDARRGAPNQVAAGCLQLAQAGLRQLGLAEMFSDD